jgi:hypothetical protein
MDSGCRAATRKPYRSRRLCSLHQPCRSKAEGRFRLTAVRLGGAKIGLSVQPRLCRLHRTRPHHRRHRSASLPLRRRHGPPRRRAPRRLPPKSARRINPNAERGAADSENGGSRNSERRNSEYKTADGDMATGEMVLFDHYLLFATRYSFTAATGACRRARACEKPFQTPSTAGRRNASMAKPKGRCTRRLRAIAHRDNAAPQTLE